MTITENMTVPGRARVTRARQGGWRCIFAATGIINYMARGWESKSVEAQIDMAESQKTRAIPRIKLDSQQLDQIRKIETIRLSRIRVIHELDSTRNPRYKSVLSKALADLDAQLATLAK